LVAKRCLILCSLILIFTVVLCACSNPEMESPSHETFVDDMNTVIKTEITESVDTTSASSVEETEITESTVPRETMDGLELVQNTEIVEDDAIVNEGEQATVPVETLEFGQLSEVKNTDFVNINWYIPDAQVELRYAGTNNFTGEIIYNFQDAYLRYGTICKLIKVSEELKEQGLYLKIWDAFRPASAQFALWEMCPDPQYVANPNRGYSSHTRGNTVDVTLVDVDGNELPMPSEYDAFTDAANREYLHCSEEARRNAKLLESTMEKHGFHGYWGEWWHFSDAMKYDVETVFDPGVISEWYPDCNEFITLRKRANALSEALDHIPLGSPMIVLGYTDQFAMVEYMGQRGFVLTNYIKPEP